MAKKEKQQRTPKERRLTEKQEKFCQYYLDTDGNASEAYRMAYDTSNMKPETVHYSAWELMNNPKITQRIDEIREERAADSQVERQKVERVLMDIVLADPKDLYIVDAKSGRVKLKLPSQLPKKVRNALKKIKNDKGVVEYEFGGKVEAARLLGSWNGWDAPKEISMTGNNLLGEIRIGFNKGEG